MIVNDYEQLSAWTLELVEKKLAEDKRIKEWARTPKKNKGGRGYIQSKHIAKALIYFNFCCAYCSCDIHKTRRYIPTRATIDHVIPINKGGMNIPENLVISCDKCNNAKENKYCQEWLEESFGKEKGQQIWDEIMQYFTWLRSGGDYATMLKVRSIESRNGLSPAKIKARFDL